jgi:hypothetical protein
MSKARTVMVGGSVDKDLCFILQPPKAAAVQDAVTVALETGTDGMILLRITPTQAVRTVCSVQSKVMRFEILSFFSGMCHAGILTFLTCLTNGTLKKNRSGLHIVVRRPEEHRICTKKLLDQKPFLRGGF